MVHAARRAHRRRTSATPYSRPYQRVPSYADAVHTAGQPHLECQISYWNDVDAPVPHPASNWHCPYSYDDDAATSDASLQVPHAPQTDRDACGKKDEINARLWNDCGCSLPQVASGANALWTLFHSKRQQHSLRIAVDADDVDSVSD